jgi:hypothetical protein
MPVRLKSNGFEETLRTIMRLPIRPAGTAGYRNGRRLTSRMRAINPMN